MSLAIAADAIGLIGALLIITAYLLLQTGRLDAQTLAFSAINALGAASILVSLMYKFNLSAFAIEAFWLLISLFGVFRALQRRQDIDRLVGFPGLTNLSLEPAESGLSDAVQRRHGDAMSRVLLAGMSVLVALVAGTATATEVTAAKKQPALKAQAPKTVRTVAPARATSLRKLTTINLQLPAIDARRPRTPTVSRTFAPGRQAFRPPLTPNAAGVQVYQQQISISPSTSLQFQVSSSSGPAVGRVRRCQRR